MVCNIVVRRNRGRMKWGFRPHPTDRKLMVGDVDMLALLARAYELIDEGCSYRQVADWLSASTEVHYNHGAFYRAYHVYCGARKRVKPTVASIIGANNIVARG